MFGCHRYSRNRPTVPVRAGLRTAGFRRFLHDDDGSLLIFGLFAFILMLMIGGIGVDLMRFERDRSVLQSTMDRAVLAAADLDQTLEPSEVVADYLDKAGLSDYLSSVTVEEGMGYRVVSASAGGDFDTHFMHMSGVETLHMPAASTAEERIDGVEISLVLDVSGSMNSNSRLINLKVAAKDFIDQMVANSTAGKLSISIVPYATQVSLSDEMMAQFNTVGDNPYSNCINFESSDFDTTEISTTAELKRTMHFDPWNRFDGRDNDPVELIGLDDYLNDTLPVCEAKDMAGKPSLGRAILPVSNDADALKSYIEGFIARGNTSIDVGMKWGTALLDPSMRGVIDALIDADIVDAGFDDRPSLYRDGNTLKVIVLMTDGENTSQYFINDGFRDGESNIWWNEEVEEYSIYVGLDTDDDDDDGITNEPMFFWPHNNEWRDHAYGEGTYEETTTDRECSSYRKNGSCKRYRTVTSTVTVDEPGSAEVLSYADLWAYTTMKNVVEDLYEPFMDDSQAWDDWYYDVRSYVNDAVKDARTKTICDAAKDEGIIIFTIGFEAPSGGKAVIKDCASSNSHFFDVDGLEIADAFSSIASSISKLRLTQ